MWALNKEICTQIELKNCTNPVHFAALSRVHRRVQHTITRTEILFVVIILDAHDYIQIARAV